MFIRKIVILLLVTFVFSGCKEKTSSKDAWKEYSTIDYLNTKMHSISPVLKSQWEEKVSSGSVGPSIYWMRGFVEVNEDIKKQLQSKYKWSIVEDPDLDYDFILDQYWHCEQWYFNNDFNKQVMTDSWVRYFYYCPDRGVVYFNAQR